MRLIRGAAGSGKTARVFREFKAALRQNEANPRIVVPTATLVRHFQHELARDGVVFSPNSVVSLMRFAFERASAGGVEARLVPGGLLVAIIRDSIERLNLPEFAEVATTEGIASILNDTIDLFENAGATPDKLAQLRKPGPQARAFEKLWRAIDRAVRERGYYTRGHLFRAAAANQERALVWMDGFLNFSPLESEFVRSLAATCELTLTLMDSPATDDVRRLALRLGAEDRLLPGNPRKPRTVVIAARKLERETDEIAKRILSLREQGTPFREIGVALRDTAAYAPLLRGTFERFGIPARFYFSRPLRTHPVAILLGGLISGALGGWDFEGAIETLRAHPRWGRSADFDRFNFKVREAMPGRGAAGLLELCETDWLRDEIAACLKTEAWKDEARKPAEWQRRFEGLSVNEYRPGALSPPRDHADVETARSHVAALRAWQEAIGSTVEFWKDPGQTVSLEEFWRVASSALETAVIEVRDDRADAVHVMSVYEARQWDVSSLFVFGLTDRDFPKRHPQNLLFPDSDIDRLRAGGIPLRKAADQEVEERGLFQCLLSRATGTLFLTHPERDATGKTVQPSRFLLDLNADAEQARECRPVPAVAAYDWGQAGHVSAPDLQTEMARLHQTISLTSLEDLAQCRFKFFSGRTLGLKEPPERPEKRLKPRVTGSILHEALERWIGDKEQDFVELFEAAFEETCRKQHLPAGYRLEVERIQLRDIARRVSANELWTADSSAAEVELVLQFPGGIAVNCRIDRLDTFGDDCVIVDYKSGRTASVEKLVESNTRLQGPLYALAARERLNLNPVAMVYWAVREDERYGWGKIPGTDLAYMPMPENWTSDARTRTIERLASFLRGEVHAHPEEVELCRWCEFARACRIEQQELVMIAEKAHGA